MSSTQGLARRSWERRLKSIPKTLPAQIGCLEPLVLLQPWAASGAMAIDSTVLRAHSGVWHRKDREAGEVPRTAIDTAAHWTRAGWHGWVYGWRLHLVTTRRRYGAPAGGRIDPRQCGRQHAGIHPAGGVAGRGPLHSGYDDPELRSRSLENFHGQFKGIFDCHGQVPTRGWMATRRFVLGAVWCTNWCSGIGSRRAVTSGWASNRWYEQLNAL